MPRLFIPALGAKLTLAGDWSFTLVEESRNTTLIEHLGDVGLLGFREETPGPGRRTTVTYQAKLPKGAVLVVDRIFIRKGAEDFDSITFFLEGAKTKAKTVKRTAVAVGPGTREVFAYDQSLPARKVRFWVKLDDANTLEFE